MFHLPKTSIELVGPKYFTFSIISIYFDMISNRNIKFKELFSYIKELFCTRTMPLCIESNTITINAWWEATCIRYL